MQSTYIYYLLWFQTVIFGILMCLKWVLLFLLHMMEMTRLYNSKRNNFSPIKPYIYLESTPWELSNGMSHYAESAFCQKLQHRHFIPKIYLNANIVSEFKKYIEKQRYHKSFTTSNCKGRKCTFPEHSWFFKYSYIWCGLLFTLLDFNFNIL